MRMNRVIWLFFQINNHALCRGACYIYEGGTLKKYPVRDIIVGFYCIAVCTWIITTAILNMVTSVMSNVHSLITNASHICLMYCTALRIMMCSVLVRDRDK
jgi:hypothetical protein